MLRLVYFPQPSFEDANDWGCGIKPPVAQFGEIWTSCTGRRRFFLWLNVRGGITIILVPYGTRFGIERRTRCMWNESIMIWLIVWDSLWVYFWYKGVSSMSTKGNAWTQWSVLYCAWTWEWKSHLNDHMWVQNGRLIPIKYKCRSFSDIQKWYYNATPFEFSRSQSYGLSRLIFVVPFHG